MNPRSNFLPVVAAIVLTGSSAVAQQVDLAQVEPLVALLQQDEAELLAAIAAGDAGRLALLAQRNLRMSFTIAKSDPPISPDDPAAVALREAYVTCANAHSNIAFLAGDAARAITTNKGGDNTAVMNDMARGGIAFFLPSFGEKWASCDALLGGRLGATAVPASVDTLLPAFEPLPLTAFTPTDVKMWRDRLAAFKTLETEITAALKAHDLDAIDEMVVPIQAFDTMIARRDHSGLGAADYAMVYECNWHVGHFRQLHDEIEQALSRPELAVESLQAAQDTLEQYRQSKALCARALGAPDSVGVVHIGADSLTLE